MPEIPVSIPKNKKRKWEIKWDYFPIVLYLISIVITYFLILKINSNHFVYTLDDAYIHLAFSQQLNKFHFGINSNEYSSPASSIIWPIILSPLANTKLGYYLPFIINILSSFLTLFLIHKILVIIFQDSKFEQVSKKKFILIIFLIIVSLINPIYNIFNGMEHTIQIFFSVLILYSLILYSLKLNVPSVLYFAFIVAPLIRYENLALSAFALFFLFIIDKQIKYIIYLTTLVLLVGIYSLIINSLGLPLLPLSVLQKTSITTADNLIILLYHNFVSVLSSIKGLLVFFILIFLSTTTIKLKFKLPITPLVLTLSTSIILHFLFSKTGRYFDYLFTIVIIGILFVYKHQLLKVLEKMKFFESSYFIILVFLFAIYRMILGVYTVTISSNNIYEQQYQMHKFITQFSFDSVAVNDLGYVSYNNEGYVLDLMGLGSYDVYKYRKQKIHNWMDLVVKEKKVKLIMIYDSWFPEIPDNWKKICELHISRKNLTLGDSTVSFYTPNFNDYNLIINQVLKFSKTLPKGCKLNFI